MTLRRAAAWLVVFVLCPLVHSAKLLAGPTHSHRGTAIVDGVNDLPEWEGAEFGVANLILPAAFGGGSTLVTFLVMNDDVNLYAAVQFPYPSSPASPAFLDFAVQFWADSETACTPTTLIDVVQLISQNGFADFRDERWPECTTVVSDVSAGGSTDGIGIWGDEGTTLFFELSHPLDSSDDLNDVSGVSPGFLGMYLFTYGCDAAANCGQVAGLARRVFLVPSNLVFFSDFEGGDPSEWSSVVP